MLLWKPIQNDSMPFRPNTSRNLSARKQSVSKATYCFAVKFRARISSSSSRNFSNTSRTYHKRHISLTWAKLSVISNASCERIKSCQNPRGIDQNGCVNISSSWCTHLQPKNEVTSHTRLGLVTQTVNFQVFRQQSGLHLARQVLKDFVHTWKWKSTKVGAHFLNIKQTDLNSITLGNNIRSGMMSKRYTANNGISTPFHCCVSVQHGRLCSV